MHAPAGGLVDAVHHLPAGQRLTVSGARDRRDSAADFGRESSRALAGRLEVFGEVHGSRFASIARRAQYPSVDSRRGHMQDGVQRAFHED